MTGEPHDDTISDRIHRNAIETEAAYEAIARLELEHEAAREVMAQERSAACDVLDRLRQELAPLLTLGALELHAEQDEDG